MKFGFENFQKKHTEPNLENWSENSALEEVLELAEGRSINKGKNFKKLLRKTLVRTLYGLVTYSVFSVGVEAGKRVFAEKEYDKAKNLLEEYKAKNNPTNYDKQYEEALKLFGQERISFLQKPSEFQDHVNKIESKIDFLEKGHGQQHSIGETIQVGLLIPIVAPDYFFNNGYKEYFIESQDNTNIIKNVDRSEEYLEKRYGFRDYVSGTQIKEENKLVFENKDKRNDTLSIETLQKIIDETYPKGWFSEEVANIKLTNNTDNNDIDASYYDGKKGGREAAHFSYFLNEMVLRNYALKDIHFAFEVISHESGHANDWVSCEGLTPQERADLVIKTSDRITDSDRFMSSYVEGLKNSDLQEDLYNKTTEYWGEICGEYLKNGKKNLSPKDVGLVEFVIKKKDPSFDIEKALERRGEIIRTEIQKESLDDKYGLARKLYNNLVSEETVQNELDREYWEFYNINQKEVDVFEKENHTNIRDITAEEIVTRKLSQNLSKLILLRQKCLDHGNIPTNLRHQLKEIVGGENEDLLYFFNSNNDDFIYNY